MTQYTVKNNIDLFSSGVPGGGPQGTKGRKLHHLWEDVILTDLVPYQLGKAFNVTNCVSISIQVSILVNPCIVAVRDGSLNAPSYPAAIANPSGMEITNGEVLAFESDEDPVTGEYVYLEPQEYSVMSLISDALTGGAVHIVYGVLP